MFGFKIVKASAYDALVSELSRAKQLVITNDAKVADLRIALDLVKKELAAAKEELSNVTAAPAEAKPVKVEKKVVKADAETKKAPRKKVVRKVEE